MMCDSETGPVHRKGQFLWNGALCACFVPLFFSLTALHLMASRGGSDNTTECTSDLWGSESDPHKLHGPHSGGKTVCGVCLANSLVSFILFLESFIL